MEDYRAGTMLILLGLMLSGASIGAQDCIPSFFNTEHRDSEWYYGVGKGSDAGEARKDALGQLYLKESGGGTAVPAETLAGWEQNEHGECQGSHYVGIRIEMARVKRNRAELKSRPPPRNSTPRSLPTVLAELEKLGARQTQTQTQNQQQSQSQSVTIQASDPTIIVVIVAILGMVIAFLAYLYRHRPSIISSPASPQRAAGINEGEPIISGPHFLAGEHERREPLLARVLDPRPAINPETVPVAPPPPRAGPERYFGSKKLLIPTNWVVKEGSADPRIQCPDDGTIFKPSDTRANRVRTIRTHLCGQRKSGGHEMEPNEAADRLAQDIVDSEDEA